MRDVPGDEVIRRLEGLESENRRLARQVRGLRRVAGAAACAALALLAVGAKALQDPTIRAERIFMHDPRTGADRVVLGVNPNTGEAGVNIRDKNGNSCIELTVDPDGRSSGLRMFDANRKRRIDIGFDVNGNLVNRLVP